MSDKCHLFFETLGTELKLDLLLRLKEKSSNVSDLSKRLGQERSKVSHALISLLDCGLVKVREKNKNRIYSLNRETTLPLLNLVDKHIKKFCKICQKTK